jgi:hypothetical protein
VSYLIKASTRSILHEGIETLFVPVEHHLDKSTFGHSVERGTYCAAEWVLHQLGRLADLERVCALNGSTEGGKLVVQLELRQPGLQLEHWLRELPRTSIAMHPREDGAISVEAPMDHIGVLAARSLDPQKFSEKHPPYWLVAKTNVVRTLEEGDQFTP